jgi:hypothetical protein
VREQARILEHHADAPMARVELVVAVGVDQHVLADLHAAVVGRQQPGNEADQASTCRNPSDRTTR